MRLIIDKQVVEDFDINTDVAITFEIASVTDIDKEKTGGTKTIKIPITPQARRMFGFSEDLHSTTFFNQGKDVTQEDHTAIIDDDDIIIIAGTPMLQKSDTRVLGSGYYNISIIGSGKEWSVSAVINALSKTGLVLDQIFSEQMIIDSWKGEDTLVRWLPVVRAPFQYREDNETKHRKMNIWDYHPFINVKALFLQIFKDAGYDIDSRFIENGNLDELYISGFLNRADVEETKKEWDFKAAPFRDYSKNVSAVTLTIGSGSTLAKIVDTADSEEVDEYVDEDGFDAVAYADDAFDNSGSFFIDPSGSCYFKPNKDVSLGFSVEIQFMTSAAYFNGPSPTGLRHVFSKGFDKATLTTSAGDQTIMRPQFDDFIGTEIVRGRKKVDIPDQYKGKFIIVELPDYKEENYRDWIIVVESPGIDLFRFDIEGKYTIVQSNPWTSRIIISNFSYERLNASMIIYEALEQVDSVFKYEFPVEKRTANIPFYFNKLIFEKSDNTPVDFTYYSTTSIAPIFSPTGIGLGDEITPDLILPNEIKQSSFLKAIKQLFNLNLYTDTFKKKVFVEPRDDFYSGPVIDWSEKIDLSKPIEIEELGADINRIFSIGYKEADYSVKKFNEDNKTIFGRYDTTILNKFAKTEENVHQNEMFSPSVVKAGSYPPAVDAKLLHVNDDGNDLVVNFDTRIVKYKGVKDLPTGQLLEFPAESAQYPLVVFSDQDENVNLCYEDRNGNTGLHKYYDNNVKMYNKSKRIACYMHLKPVDIEPFAKLNLLKQDFRARFKLMIDGEYVYCNLESISDYKKWRSTKCVFVKRV